MLSPLSRVCLRNIMRSRTPSLPPTHLSGRDMGTWVCVGVCVGVFGWCLGLFGWRKCVLFWDRKMCLNVFFFLRGKRALDVFLGVF